MDESPEKLQIFDQTKSHNKKTVVMNKKKTSVNQTRTHQRDDIHAERKTIKKRNTTSSPFYHDITTKSAYFIVNKDLLPTQLTHTNCPYMLRIHRQPSLPPPPTPTTYVHTPNECKQRSANDTRCWHLWLFLFGNEFELHEYISLIFRESAGIARVFQVCFNNHFLCVRTWGSWHRSSIGMYVTVRGAPRSGSGSDPHTVLLNTAHTPAQHMHRRRKEHTE